MGVTYYYLTLFCYLNFKKVGDFYYLLIDVVQMSEKVPGMLYRVTVKIADKKQVLARIWRKGNPRALLVGM